MSIKNLEFEGKMFKSKVPIPFVEENSFLPQKVFVEGYFPAGTIFKFLEPICSQRTDAFGTQINHYCHAVSFLYSNKFNGADDSEDEYTIIFHVDLSAMFLLLDLIDEKGNVVPL